MLTVVWLVLGMLAGAALLTGFLFMVYMLIGSVLLHSDTMFWLFFLNFFVGLSAGAALGLVSALHLCGYSTAARTAALPVGMASLAFPCTVYALNERKNWPGVYTLRQGVGVVLRCAGETIVVCFGIAPLPCLVSLGLIYWGVAGLRS